MGSSPTGFGLGTMTVTSAPVYRAGPKTPTAPVIYAIQSISATWSWGVEPGEATIVYDYASVPVTTGWSVNVQVGGHILFGVCVSDSPVNSTNGAQRVLKFQDNRYWIQKDQVYCSFNQLDDHIVNGHREKRYVHHFPDLESTVTLNPTAQQIASGDNMVYPAGVYFSGLIKTYTNSPFTAAQIIEFLLNSQTVRDDWTVDFHPDQFTNPAWDIDAFGGKSLGAVLQEISDQQGMVFTNTGGPFNLIWCRKGLLDERWPATVPMLPLPETNPSTGEQQVLVDNVIQGTSLSNNPTNVHVLGDRNTYMPLNIPMVPDWSPGWEQWWDVILFREWVYQNGNTTAPVNITGAASFPVNTPFSTIGASTSDPEQIIARQLALVQAQNLTVSQVATMNKETLFVDDPVYADYKKFSGKSRLDMPAELYISQVLYRAFSFPEGFSIINSIGVNVPIDSMEILDKMIARVTYDAITGEMFADPNLAADGNGLALIQGYQVGQGMFELLNPDRFKLDAWNNAQVVWQPAQFQIDDSGEPGGQFILFNEPIISSASLVRIVDGLGVFAANPLRSDGVTLGVDIPKVQCTVCFAAEKYSYFVTGEINAGQTETYSIGGLNREVVFTYGTTDWVEIPYSDGLLADQKAALFVAPLQLCQYIYDKGGYSHPLLPNAQGNFPAAIGLNPILDKITVSMSPNGGLVEQVEYTTEVARQVYTPERDLDRNVKLKTLLPGQANLRREAATNLLIASALSVSPQALHSLEEAFIGFFGSDEPLHDTSNLGDPAANAPVYPVGTPLWGMPGTSSGTTRTNTISVPPIQTTAQHSIFHGITTRDGEQGGAGQTISVQRSGTIYAQIMGPVAVGDPVGQVAGQPYLSHSASINFVGTAQEAITTATQHLIRVQVGSTTPSEGYFPFEILKVSETQVSINPQSALLSGLDIVDTVTIFGLDVTFTVTAGALIYLEVLFDINNNPIFANIGTAGADQPLGGTGAPFPSRTGWRNETSRGGPSASCYPALVGTIDENNLANEKSMFSLESEFWVGYPPSGVQSFTPNIITADAALALFTPANAPARFQQFYAYALIGFCTQSSGASGISMQGAGPNTAFTIVQCVHTHLMLQGFCSGGVPSQVPVPFSGPEIQALPTPTVLGSLGHPVSRITITMPTGYSSATIWYSLDGAAAVQYAGKFLVSTAGTHVVAAYATQPGWFNSETVTGNFTV
jgi:hypothetical protein